MNFLFYVIYETTNNVNGNTYRGCHKTEDLSDGYLGSGKLLKRAIEKYGKSSFSTEILKFCDNEFEMYQLEKVYVDEYFCGRSDTYNIRCGGLGGRMLPEIRAQVADKLRKPKSDSTREKMRKSRLGKKMSKETKAKIGIKSKGRTPSQDSRQKMSDAAKSRKNNTVGTVWVTNGVLNRRVKEDDIPNGFFRGRSTGRGKKV